MNTPRFVTSDPVDFADSVRDRLLSLGDKVAELRKSPSIRYHMLVPEPEKVSLRRAAISESYADLARQEILDRSVKIKDKHEGNAILCNRVRIA